MAGWRIEAQKTRGKIANRAARVSQRKFSANQTFLEERTTRFRISFNYQLEQMPDNAQRDVILEIIHKHKDYLTSLEAALADVKDQTA